MDSVDGRREELAGTETGNVSAIACSAIGQLALGDDTGSIRLYEPNRVDKCVVLPEQHAGAVWQLLFSRRGDRLLSFAEDRCVRVWDTRTGSLLWQKDLASESNTNGEEVRFVAFSPGGDCVAWAVGTSDMWLLDLASQEKRQLQGHIRTVLDMEFSPNGALLASADWGGTVHVWNVMSAGAQVPMHTIPHPLWVLTLAFAPDSSTLVVACGDHTLRFWDVQTWQQKCRLACYQLNNLRFAPDGKMLAARGPSTLELFRCD